MDDSQPGSSRRVTIATVAAIAIAWVLMCLFGSRWLVAHAPRWVGMEERVVLSPDFLSSRFETAELSHNASDETWCFAPGNKLPGSTDTSGEGLRSERRSYPGTIRYDSSTEATFQPDDGALGTIHLVVCPVG